MDFSDKHAPDQERRQAILAALDYPTPAGNAHLSLDVPAAPTAVLVLGHGAGGDIDAPDLLAARGVALLLGVAVVRVRQPYRVAGRRAAAPAAQLDRAFGAVLAGIGGLPGLDAGLPLLVGGRSSGARVAARVGHEAGAAALLALAFPLAPPGRPGVTRLEELTGAMIPALVVQGSRDGFGSAQTLREAIDSRQEEGRPKIEVAEIPYADHSFRTRKVDPTTSAQALDAVRTAVARWLQDQVGFSPDTVRVP